MAKKFRSSNHNEWHHNELWAENSDLSALLRWHMPDSDSNGIVSYTSAMSLGLILCAGSIYDKAKILFQLVESNSSQQTVFKKDEYLAKMITSIVEFVSIRSELFLTRSLTPVKRKSYQKNLCESLDMASNAKL